MICKAKRGKITDLQDKMRNSLCHLFCTQNLKYITFSVLLVYLLIMYSPALRNLANSTWEFCQILSFSHTGLHKHGNCEQEKKMWNVFFEAMTQYGIYSTDFGQSFKRLQIKVEKGAMNNLLFLMTYCIFKAVSKEKKVTSHDKFSSFTGFLKHTHTHTHIRATATLWGYLLYVRCGSHSTYNQALWGLIFHPHNANRHPQGHILKICV